MFYFILRVKYLTFERNFVTMKNLLLLFLSFASFSLMAQTISIDGAYRFSLIESTGLSSLYVVAPESRPGVRYTSNSSSEIRWYRYGEGGLSSKVEVLGTQSGNTSTLFVVDKDYGYIVEQDGNVMASFWLSSYIPVISCEVSTEQDFPCESVNLMGKGIGISYYTTAGLKKYLPRYVSYTTLAWNEETSSIVENVQDECLADVKSETEMSFPAPYGRTSITIVDSIPTAWGASPTHTMVGEYDSPLIFLRAKADQKMRGALNEAAELPTSGFGGSAPVEMTFKAYVNGDNYFAWEFSSTSDFENIDALYAENMLEYAFKDEGTTYVRLHAYNDYCERDTVFEIHVGESKLEAPNAFSPYGSPGVNDEWKVAYKSIVEYKCWIYNRWGQKLYYSQDPAEGWNGRFNGPIVPPGVYFYVIEARGADGQKFNLKGHINILRSKKDK